MSYEVKIQNTVQEWYLVDEETQAYAQKTQEQIDAEKQVLVDVKTAEVQQKVDAYLAAQQYQNENGGPGPVADFETMRIVNEFSGVFSVTFN